MTAALFRVASERGPRLARGSVEAGPLELLGQDVRLDGLLASGTSLSAVLSDWPGHGPCPPGSPVLAPIESQEVWCTGVTYERTREARRTGASEPAIYDRLYDAARPELFFKAPGWRVRGPGESVTVRADSAWNMAEPELGLVIAADRSIEGFVIANDMTARSIEADNPLYLPQAKVYDGGCALGPAIVPIDEAGWPLPILMRIVRAGEVLFEGQTTTARMRRSLEDLAGYLFRALRFPVGVVLLTGNGVVPDASVSLRAGDRVEIEIEPLGALLNPVVSVA
ncbi:MAG TPA: fumarylacetoacetate hydrolase family protein [Candidatus Limnocylindrales bacterium]|nr:fumarylacetoacetate hydrolase family protein [Candidatus Limnocylindrales bacterium]